jgi:phosphatidylglycerol:prolipoprotein diacylglycerol transferase
MHPILLQLGPVTIYSYGMMLVAAFATATWLARRCAARAPSPGAAGPVWALSGEQVVDACAVALLGGIIGGRAFFGLLHWDEFWGEPLEWLALWRGGLVWYGGLLGGLLACWLYTRAKGVPFLRAVDQLIPFAALGHAIGRVGCFLNGCCYGRPSEAWCAVTLPGQPGPVLPTQLFESALLLILFGLLRGLQRPQILDRPGRLLGLYLAAYGALRFPLEFLRGDQAPWRMGLTLQQLISVALVSFGLILWHVPRARGFR